MLKQPANTTASSAAFDRRLTPARADLAAEHLRGLIEAPRYVAGKSRRVTVECAALTSAPGGQASIDTQALFGEEVVVFDVGADGWAWVQLQRDSYVGYIAADCLGEAAPAPTHHVRVPRTFVYLQPDMKSPVVMPLPLGAQVSIVEPTQAFARLATGGFVWAGHVAPLTVFERDFVSVAERFLNVPYLWGGKTFAGLDCSGLVQISLAACGVAAPRDTDMMAQGLGDPAKPAKPGEPGQPHDGLRRGDLVFWKGHIGVMRDTNTLLHANGHHMMVASEPLEVARQRILRNSFGAVTGVRRLSGAGTDQVT